MTAAAEEGKRAYPHSKGYAANPYKLGTREFLDWEDGYFQAEFAAPVNPATPTGWMLPGDLRAPPKPSSYGRR